MEVSKEHPLSNPCLSQGVSVVTESLSIVLKTRKGNEVSILNDVSFTTLRGEMTAIMGPSGSGKTTLLNMLAGRVSKRMSTSGKVYFNGREYSARRVRDFSGYVMQEDHFLEYLTVRETLHFAAQLRLKSWTRQARLQRMNECLSDMGLMNCLDVLVGGPSVKGISGGQRKRVSIAIALLSNPQLLFLDEPTSGLDASLAYDVIKILDSITQTHGRTVLCTIHQPRSQVYHLFDTLLLLRAGDIVYRGPAAEATTYFASLGFQCPAEFNPPDFFLDLLTTDNVNEKMSQEIPPEDEVFNRDGQDDDGGDAETSSAPVEKAASIVRVVVTGEQASRFAQEYKESEYAVIQQQLGQEALADAQDIATSADMSTSVTPWEWIKSVGVLVQRDLRNNWRSPTDFYVNMISSLLIAIVFSTIWWKVPWPSTVIDECEENSVTLRNIMGGMIQPIANTTFSAFDAALSVVRRRALVNREAGSGMYTHSARFVSTGLSDMCMLYWGVLMMSIITYWCLGLRANAARFFTYLFLILVLKFAANSYAVMCGSLASNIPVASALVPLGSVLFFFTSGLQLADEDIPGWLVWLKNISYVRFLFQGFARDQFQNDEFLDVCGRFQTPHGAWANIGIALSIACAFRLFAFLAQCFMHKQIGLEA
eukprot:Gregarina_sp_Pseudo_9__5488@NODE_701_length_2347_cov_46_097487_g662_i0_p1_GENE_NODE_701_length_2347_cov_46_097487_g662_i0NODE_701_length_2347_cov_46_097487_g662_i0_p1_ORF_typecomplete_len651_score31_01ABC_tran/PF00005_27/1_4e35ABC2_membrane/PF01061_24/5_3e32AAA_21/PF13304_6/1_6AAA_21/PF13304_6/3_6e05SMC_N/PF02463_19/1_9SMC_N/PF02463_19/0_002AAA_15/PF13175_6/0_063AAA_15/PF13175_6/0_29RsgA_GTPase/PF03193_16/2_3e05AAA_25/PF13481_6/6_3e05AAA_29/PF13555_6/8_2e05AAA_16/PF13191_6/0_00017ATPase/PF06745_